MKSCAWTVAAALAAAGCGAGGGGQGVAWDDPPGDVVAFANAPDRPRLDIVRVEAQGRDGALRLRVRMKDNLDRFFGYTSAEGRKYGTVVANFYLDTDNRPETGGKPMFGDRGPRPLEGYEYQVTLMAGYRYRQGQASGTSIGDVYIDTKTAQGIEPLVVLGLNRLKQGSSSYDFDATRKTLPADAKEIAAKATTMRGEWVETSIPYAWLGLKAGDTVRLCFREPASGSFKGEDFSADRTLRLGS